MAKFFVSNEIDLPPENINAKVFFEAIGYEVKFSELIYELEAEGLIDEYGDYPPTALEKIEVVETDYEGFGLSAIYDTEDGPMALYLKPKSGLALKAVRLKEIEASNSLTLPYFFTVRVKNIAGHETECFIHAHTISEAVDRVNQHNTVDGELLATVTSLTWKDLYIH